MSVILINNEYLITFNVYNIKKYKNFIVKKCYMLKKDFMHQKLITCVYWYKHFCVHNFSWSVAIVFSNVLKIPDEEYITRKWGK